MSALDKQIGGNHYREGGIQPVQYIEANALQFLEGSVVKRVTRHDRDGGKGRQDIEKAIHELQLLLELRYPMATAFDAPDKYANYGPAAPNSYCTMCHSVPCECLARSPSRD